jgi:hypothetical protein
MVGGRTQLNPNPRRRSVECCDTSDTSDADVTIEGSNRNTAIGNRQLAQTLLEAGHDGI